MTAIDFLLFFHSLIASSSSNVLLLPYLTLQSFFFSFFFHRSSGFFVFFIYIFSYLTSIVFPLHLQYLTWSLKYKNKIQIGTMKPIKLKQYYRIHQGTTFQWILYLNKSHLIKSPASDSLYGGKVREKRFNGFLRIISPLLLGRPRYYRLLMN